MEREFFNNDRKELKHELYHLSGVIDLFEGIKKSIDQLIEKPDKCRRDRIYLKLARESMDKGLDRMYSERLGLSTELLK